ncbi:hypothetical protein AK830_g6874 [Neonectria ditissima]|uniref:Uncharacterized protein n=1 Tax=Neonectria ditissima TaxID=78410 RepID=A0A0P7BHH5_9HYPO|nr:hypothetical protein AK830_g6874 [Neonectria ditissima]
MNTPRENSARTSKPFVPRRRGTRGAKRSGSSTRRQQATSAPAEEGKEVHDPAARQQMKQTMAIALMTNPAIPLPFPLATLLGITTLVFPNETKNRE